MFGGIINFFKKLGKKEGEKESSRETAKERLHLVLAQDRANISADFLEMMKQEIIDVIKKYINVDENAIEVKLTNKTGDDGTVGAPALYANIPIVKVKEEIKKVEDTKPEENKVKEKKAVIKEEIEEASDKEVEKSKETSEKEVETEELSENSEQSQAEEIDEEEQNENKQKENEDNSKNKENATSQA